MGRYRADQDGEKPLRGFGGRLYFFGPNNSQEPVKVDGTLVIYAFNETNRDPANVVPDKKIVYPVKHFKRPTANRSSAIRTAYGFRGTKQGGRGPTSV